MSNLQGVVSESVELERFELSSSQSIKKLSTCLFTIRKLDRSLVW